MTIEREIVIDAPIEVVWRTITEPDQIVRWFAKRVEFDGDVGVLEFENVSVPFVVQRAERPRLFAFRWNHPEGEVPAPGNSMLVEFTLVAEHDERTRLRVVETGLDQTSWSDDEKARYTEDHRRGWQINFDRLSALFRR